MKLIIENWRQYLGEVEVTQTELPRNPLKVVKK